MIYIYNFSLIFDIFNTHKNGKNHTQILLLNHKPRSHNEKTNPSEETKILQSLHVAGTAAFNCRCVGHSAGGLALRDAIASCMAAADMPCWGGVQFLDVFCHCFCHRQVTYAGHLYHVDAPWPHFCFFCLLFSFLCVICDSTWSSMWHSFPQATLQGARRTYHWNHFCDNIEFAGLETICHLSAQLQETKNVLP